MKVLSAALVGLMVLAATLLILGEAADASLRKLKPGEIYIQEVSTTDDFEVTACTTKVFKSDSAPTNTNPLSKGQIVTWSESLYTSGSTKRGRWEGYCVGIGDSRGQICTHSYVIKDRSVFGVNGTIVGTSTFTAGQSRMTVIVNGGSGGFQGIDQAITVTYKGGKSNHTIAKC